MFMNTAIIVYLVNSRYLYNAFEGQHGDFSAQWYATVGLAIVTTILIGTVNPHVGELVKPAGQGFLLRRIVGDRLARTEELLHFAYTPRPFQLHKRVGPLLNM